MFGPFTIKIIRNLWKEAQAPVFKMLPSEAWHADRRGNDKEKLFYWIVYIQIATGSFLELFPDPQDAPGTISARDPQASYKHVCLLVDDLPATLRQLAARGLEISGTPTQGLDSNLQYWLNDPDGNPIELMQIMPTSPQAAADARMQTRSR